MKRVIIRTKTTDTHTDGSSTSSTTERVEETPQSGLIEAWGFLILLFATLLVFLFTYRIVSNITQKEHHGIQERQYENYQQ